MDIVAIIALAIKYLPVALAVVGAAAAVAALTPSKSDDRIVQLILDVLNKLALNVGKAKNVDDV